jgi:hypothetical protein
VRLADLSSSTRQTPAMWEGGQREENLPRERIQPGASRSSLRSKTEGLALSVLWETTEKPGRESGPPRLDCWTRCEKSDLLQRGEKLTHSEAHPSQNAPIYPAELQHRLSRRQDHRTDWMCLYLPSELGSQRGSKGTTMVKTTETTERRLINVDERGSRKNLKVEDGKGGEEVTLVVVDREGNGRR